MNEYIFGVKISVVTATIVGGVLALPYLKMTRTQKLLSVPSAVFMSYQLAAPLSAWVGLPEGAVGALMGLFGMAICHLIFDSLQKSDLSVKFSDIIELLRLRGK
jgi:energy-converting hydrogenase Eha subunit A